MVHDIPFLFVHRIFGDGLSFWFDRSSSVSTGDIAIVRVSRGLGTTSPSHDLMMMMSA
jgi:hypothetical protein